MADDLKLPSRADLAKLPRWARVAYAVRCAQRLRPMARKQNAGYTRVLIELAYKAASDPASVSAKNIRSEIDQCNDAVYDGVDALPDAAYDAAVKAAEAAAKAKDGNDFVYVYPTKLGRSAGLAASAARRDYEKLAELAEIHGWSDDSGVKPIYLGPIWPTGVPEGWPESEMENFGDDANPPTSSQRGEPRLRLRVATLPLADSPENREDLKAHLRKLIKAANLVNREHGGPGLEIAGARLVSPAGVGVGVSDE